ncbi:MAG: hypothetical protein M1817_004654 [Caeruleum heppii]|nr:MAG: hypothetical protein M1817_004654 [Caeruleum heppii]
MSLVAKSKVTALLDDMDRSVSEPCQSPSPETEAEAEVPLSGKSSDELTDEDGEDSALHQAHTSRRPRNRPQLDPATGLRTAFPGLDDSDEEGDCRPGTGGFYGPAEDGMQYLKMVRTEAKSVPSLLVAPPTCPEAEDQVIYDSGKGDVRGYYHDGAYTAAPADPRLAVKTEKHIPSSQDPQVVYYESLLLHFRLLHANLRCPPPSAVVQSLSNTHPTTISPVRGRRQCRRLLAETDPVSAQLALMHQSTVLSLLHMLACEGEYLSRKRPISERTGRWIWALLGRLEEYGCLRSEEVGVLRELGKSAVRVLAGLRWGNKADALGNHGSEGGADEEEYKVLELEEQDQGYQHDVETARDASSSSSANNKSTTSPIEDRAVVERAKAALLEQISQCPPSQPAQQQRGVVAVGSAEDHLQTENVRAKESRITFATLDMIITIVGEAFGQKDLLEFREQWDVAET